MSSSPIPKLNVNPVQQLNEDFDFVQNHLEQMTATIVINHGALCEILKCEMSSAGAIQMKAIAEHALLETQRIALTLGGKANA
jgi:hypothetical protein